MSITKVYFGTTRVKAFEALGPIAVAGTEPTRPGYVVIAAENKMGVWQPAHWFEEIYEPASAMGFGHALAALISGVRVARAGWASAHLTLGDGSISLTAGMGAASPITWRPSQADMLANDWRIVE